MDKTGEEKRERLRQEASFSWLRFSSDKMASSSERQPGKETLLDRLAIPDFSYVPENSRQKN